MKNGLIKMLNNSTSSPCQTRTLSALQRHQRSPKAWPPPQARPAQGMVLAGHVGTGQRGTCNKEGDGEPSSATHRSFQQGPPRCSQLISIMLMSPKAVGERDFGTGTCLRRENPVGWGLSQCGLSTGTALLHFGATSFESPRFQTWKTSPRTEVASQQHWVSREEDILIIIELSD